MVLAERLPVDEVEMEEEWLCSLHCKLSCPCNGIGAGTAAVCSCEHFPISALLAILLPGTFLRL